LSHTKTADRPEAEAAPADVAADAPAPPGPGHRVPALDGVRGLATLVVLVYHFMPPGSADPLTARLIRLSEIGWVGVDLFFVLSGFLITGILLDAKGTPHYFRNFYARRTLRIFPLYYGTLAAVFVAFPLVVAAAGLGPALETRLGEFYGEYRYLQQHEASFWLYLSNTPGFVDPVRWNYFMSHLWSLSVEEHFYLAWPAVVFLLGRRSLIAACVACAAASLTLRLLVAPTPANLFCYIFTPMRLDGLAMGALLAALARGPGGVAPLARPFALAGGVAAAALVVGFGAQDGLGFGSQFALTWGISLLAIAFAGFLALVAAAPPASPLGRVMGGSFLRFFGRYSYALYVFNRFLMLPCKRLFPSERLGAALGSPALGALAHVVLSIVLTVGLAMLSWHLYEKHFLKLKTYFEYRAPAPPA
jgi:peptidoglycan/LPS O-acetylase OafA/YrhL